MPRVLVVDDDAHWLELVEDWLDHQKYVVDKAENAVDAGAFIKGYEYDVIILDWDLPDGSGIDLCRAYRAQGGRKPVIMLTGKQAVDDKEEGLDAGADDYITKPVDLRELSARLRALLRRPPMVENNTLSIGDLEMDLTEFKVKRAGKQLDLWPVEFALLEFFMRHPDRVFNADALLQNVWKAEVDAGPETVRTTIRRLRVKLDGDSKQSLIKNVYGFGYKLQTDAE
jgi:DNA-binding response OmpR family regulator